MYRRALALLTLSAGTLMAQQPTGQTSLAAELTGLTKEWTTAAQRHDTTTLERLMAPEFTLVHPSQDDFTRRAEWVAAESRVRTKAFRYDALKVVQYGDALAVVSGILVVDAEADGRPVTPVTAITDVWARRANGWMIVTRYATSAPELGPRIAPRAPAPVAAVTARAPSAADANAPGCAGIVARALLEAQRRAAAAAGTAQGQPSAEPRDAFFPFEVEHPAATTAETEALRKSGFSHRDLLVQFVVDSTGVVDLPTIKVLAVTAPLRAKLRASDSTSAVTSLRLWKYRPAEIGGCAARQVVQEPVRAAQ